MRVLIHTLLTAIFTASCLGRTLQYTSPRHVLPRDVCPGTGEPGGVYIEATATVNNAPKQKSVWRPATDGTTCIKKDELLKLVANRDADMAQASISLIGPDKGGHCLVYHSEGCLDNTGMNLENPNNLPLLFHK